MLSACRGVTDALLRLVSLAERQDDSYRVRARRACASRHATIAETLLTPESARLYLAGFDRDCHDLEGILHTVKLTRSAAQQRQRSDRRLRRDLVHQAVPPLLSRSAAAAAAPCSGSMRAQCVVVEWGPLGPGVQWAESRANLHGPRATATSQGTLIITGFIASDRARRADDARPQRQRLLRLDLRRAARCRGDPHLDGRRRRAVGRSAPRARCDGHRLAVLQRGDGARVLRREGHPSADHGAGRRQRHPDLDPQHVRAGEARHADLRASRQSTLPVKGITSIEQGRADQSRRRRHDRRAGHGASPVRRAARGGHLGHPDLAGQLRAFDLLRHPAGPGRARRRAWCARRSSAS